MKKCIYFKESSLTHCMPIYLSEGIPHRTFLVENTHSKPQAFSFSTIFHNQKRFLKTFRYVITTITIRLQFYAFIESLNSLEFDKKLIKK